MKYSDAAAWIIVIRLPISSRMSASTRASSVSRLM
jgi:hypothetical protein